MDSKTKIVVCLIAVVTLVLVFTTTLLLRGRRIYGPPPFPMEAAERLSVDQLADKAGDVGTLILPTWMPGQAKLREIYFLGGLAILVYSDRDVRDYREDDVTIQISRTNSSPTQEQLQQQRSSREVMKVKDFWVVISEDAAPDPYMKERGVKPMLAYLWNDGFYYIITANKAETTREDMIGIVENMKPVGPETLRKPTDAVAR